VIKLLESGERAFNLVWLQVVTLGNNVISVNYKNINSVLVDLKPFNYNEIFHY